MKIQLRKPLLLLAAVTLCMRVETISASDSVESSSGVPPLSRQPENLPAKISRAALFYQNLSWIGSQPPTEAENVALLAEIEQMRTNGVPRTLPGLEQFISLHPDSGWTPPEPPPMARPKALPISHSLIGQACSPAWEGWTRSKLSSRKRKAEFSTAGRCNRGHALHLHRCEPITERRWSMEQ